MEKLEVKRIDLFLPPYDPEKAKRAVEALLSVGNGWAEAWERTERMIRGFRESGEPALEALAQYLEERGEPVWATFVVAHPATGQGEPEEARRAEEASGYPATALYALLEARTREDPSTMYLVVLFPTPHPGIVPLPALLPMRG